MKTLLLTISILFALNLTANAFTHGTSAAVAHSNSSSNYGCECNQKKVTVSTPDTPIDKALKISVIFLILTGGGLFTAIIISEIKNQ